MKSRIYVAQRFMWRSPQGLRKGGRFGADKRHITVGSETAKELHNARVLAPHLFFLPFPTRVTGRQRLRFHLKIDFGVDIGGVDGLMVYGSRCQFPRCRLSTTRIIFCTSSME